MVAEHVQPGLALLPTGQAGYPVHTFWPITQDDKQMSTPDSTYAKPFLTIPEQIQRLRTRGLDCGTETFAAGVLERYGYYRLSGYWHLYRARPEPPADRFDKDGREIRLDSFMPETSLAHVVALYEFDHELRT